MKTIIKINQRSFLLRKIVFVYLTTTLLFFGSIILTVTADENQNGKETVGSKNIADEKDVDKMPDKNIDKTKIEKTQPQPKTKKQSLFDEVRELIQKLGDDSFVVRERAGKRLLQIGAVAEPELRRAIKNNDTEIALQAAMLLSQLESILRDSGNDEILNEIIKIYTSETDPTIKLACIWHFASPLPDSFSDGEGLKPLCRIVRFDKDQVMRNEAAKCLIALSPFASTKREKWYKTILRIFNKTDEDAVFKLIHDFVSLRIELNNLRKKTETEVENLARKSGKTVEYPVKIARSQQLENRINKFADDLNKFQNDPFYSKIKSGHWVDILVLYAVVEMYDELGMNQKRDKIIEKILTIREQKIQNKPVMILHESDNKKMNEHIRAALILQHKQHLNWAEKHFKLVIDEGDLTLKVSACKMLSMIKHFMADLPSAIEYLEKCTEIVKSEEYTNTFNDSQEQIKNNTMQILAYQAQIAAEKNDWTKAKELVDRTLELNPYEIDTIILRHKICELDTQIDQTYKLQMRSIIEKATLNIRQEIDKHIQGNIDGIRPHVACNQAAWLLANTNGEFAVARDLIEIAIKNEPDASTYIDTQAHVFALGKQFDKAIETQMKAIKLSPEIKLYKKALEQFKKQKNTQK
ncbi:MAG: hypothetical protein LBT09_08870 [Planctomycetaceae bacterium]|jgi:tetratricopeptide (TPR) repeat protein|nr:hypothetical protein [Planctomycetaceae bacterium]